MSVKETLLEAFRGISFSLAQAYEKNPNVPKDSVRA